MLLRAQGFSAAPPAHVLGLDPTPSILSWLVSWNFPSFGLYLRAAANNPVSHRQPSWGLAPAGSTEGGGPAPQDCTLQHPPSADPLPLVIKTRRSYCKGWKRGDTFPLLGALCTPSPCLGWGWDGCRSRAAQEKQLWPLGHKFSKKKSCLQRCSRTG